MNLIKLYIQEVTRRLPDKTRNDIALELESTIYDMLPEDYSEEDVHRVLETLGNPAVLASKYNDKPMHLIGPKYYDAYITLLKLVLPIAAIISFIAIVAVKVFSPVDDGAVLETMLSIMGQGIGNTFNVLIHTFFWFTVTFVIAERVDGIKDNSPVSSGFKPWSPEDLKHSIYVPKYKKIKSFELSCGLVWTAMWGTTYFYANHLLGIYENGENGLRMVTPAFNQDVLLSFWPLIVLLIGAEIALAIYKLINKQWTYKLATFFSIHQIASLVILVIILTHANLFTPEFLNQMGDIFTATPTRIENSLIWGTITIFVAFAGWGIFDVYKRATIKTGINK
ncbi:MAG TPA: hypothetical protein DEO65_07380 [Bacillus bacterium]|uniref:Uncharacterized protein n=1 Tax=Siminovitchia fordii TaxID=254759 RepID=A0ABQ4KCJ1_9BACI|nr:hypothetical protein [Siminovitchia fordii]GIN22772.1 hypothetical protein J1TS3_39060 [Siminovitchia fordii]HBZ09684.1 hypothetical protein [Bacillus sp. (in: firmicutes)]